MTGTGLSSRRPRSAVEQRKEFSGPQNPRERNQGRDSTRQRASDYSSGCGSSAVGLYQSLFKFSRRVAARGNHQDQRRGEKARHIIEYTGQRKKQLVHHVRGQRCGNFIGKHSSGV